MNKIRGLLLTAAMGLALSTSAHATLIDRGNGMIYDSDQDITWLQDANYAMTSGYDADGRMTWSAATTWVDNLSYGGFDDWRLASVTDNGNDGCTPSYNGTECGYNVDTSGSELAYMWYDILGNTPLFDTDASGPQVGWGLTSTSADGVGILNLQSDVYWSGTGYAPIANLAWSFHTFDGSQHAHDRNNEFYAWAVRTGDVATASVPEPGMLLLMTTGLAGLAGTQRRRRWLAAVQELGQHTR
jgi:hypothetical protein